MARGMGGGLKIYVLRRGLPGRPDRVATLDDAEPSELATVTEQREFAHTWLAERGMK